MLSECIFIGRLLRSTLRGVVKSRGLYLLKVWHILSLNNITSTWPILYILSLHTETAWLGLRVLWINSTSTCHYQCSVSINCLLSSESVFDWISGFILCLCVCVFVCVTYWRDELEMNESVRCSFASVTCCVGTSQCRTLLFFVKHTEQVRSKPFLTRGISFGLPRCFSSLWVLAITIVSA